MSKGGISLGVADSRYSRFPDYPRLLAGARFMGLGDSMTAGDTGDSTVANMYSRQYGSSFLSQAAIRLGLRVVGVAGVGGETSLSIRNRVESQVLPLRPQVVHVLAGANDVGQNVALSTCMENIAWICDRLRLEGIVPILGGLPPRPATTVRAVDGNTYAKATALLRRMTQDYASRNRILFVPYHLALGSTGASYEAFGSETLPAGSASYNQAADGVHPSSPTGVHAMGVMLANYMAPLLPAEKDMSWITTSQSDDLLNLIPLNSSISRGWLADTGGGPGNTPDGIPDGWTLNETMTNHTKEVIAENGINWWRVTVPTNASGSTSIIYEPSSSATHPRGWAEGNRMLGAVRLRMSGCRDGALTGVKAIVTVQYTSGGARTRAIEAMMDQTDGLVMWEWTIPAGATLQRIILEVSTQGTRITQGVVEFARPALWNLTRLGLT